MQTQDFLQEWQDRSAASLQSTRTTGTANKPLPHSAAVSTTQRPAHPSLLRVRTLSLHISKWTSIRPFTATHLACTAASADTGHSLVSPPRVTPLSRVPAQLCTHQGSWCPSPDPSAATTPPARTIQQPASCHLQQCMAKHRRYLLQCTLIHSFSPTTSAGREAADPPHSIAWQPCGTMAHQPTAVFFIHFKCGADGRLGLLVAGPQPLEDVSLGGHSPRPSFTGASSVPLKGCWRRPF